jgi:hypothetical protein
MDQIRPRKNPENPKNGISSHSILTKIKTATSNMISNMGTNPSQKAYFIKGFSEIFG